MKTKKMLALVLSLALTALLAAGCGAPATTPPPAANTPTPAANTPSPVETAAATKVGLIALGFGTQSFNDDILDGLKLAEQELGVGIMSLEVVEVSDTANALRTLIEQGANLLVVPTSDYRDGMETVAAEYPDASFVYLAEVITDGPANIMSIAYREHEAAFLAGAMAGLLTQSNSVGAVLAVNEAVQYRYQYGYTAGVKAVNPDCEVQVAFTNSYTDVGKGSELAGVMYNRGADYVGTYAGACNLGVFEAASQAGEGKYCFGAANGQFDQMPDKIIASVVKPVNQAIYTIIENFTQGEFDASVPFSLGLKEGGVNFLFTPLGLYDSIPADALAAIEDLRAKVISGEIVVPGTEEAYNAFNYSYTK